MTLGAWAPVIGMRRVDGLPVPVALLGLSLPVHWCPVWAAGSLVMFVYYGIIICHAPMATRNRFEEEEVQRWALLSEPPRPAARPAARPATALPTNEQGHSLTTSPSLQPLRCPRPALALTPAQRRHKSASSNRRPCVGVELVDDLELASHLGDALPASAGGTR